MKFVYPNQGTVRGESTTVARTWWPSSQRAREALAIAVAVATVIGVLWGIGASVIARLENRLIDRMGISHRELSAQIEGADRERGAQIEGLERSMAEGFKQSHQRMDRIEARMDRTEERLAGRMDRIESDVDAIEKHLLRIGLAIGIDQSPAVPAPAVATPDRNASSSGALGSISPPPRPLSSEH